MRIMLRLLNPAAVVQAKSSYANTDLTYPLGLGLKYNLGKNFDLGLEWKTRLTRTDKLDAFESRCSETTELGITTQHLVSS